MHERLRRLSTRALSALLLALGPLACTSPLARPIVGPDGSAMVHVRCGADQGACFRLAGELCPRGYDMKPVLSGNDGNFLVRCRAGSAIVSAIAVCPAPAATPLVPVVASDSGPHGLRNEGWPPASEPWPAAYPWPPPETSAGAQAPPIPTGAELDLGY
jgi:hypothetical protein